MKLGRTSWHDKGESSHTAFPELRRLPSKAKLPIRNFIQDKLSKFQEDKDVSRRMWLLAEAVKELNDDDDDDDDDGEKEAGGPYGTILHTACAVGNYWLVKLQIEAGVDVFALDQHSWTALMVATAKRHTSCADLLSEHMETRKGKVAPQAFPPTGLGQSKPKRNALIGQDNLTVVANSTLYIISNHPIPSHFKTFYYEIKVLSEDKHHLCVHASATKLLYTNSSFLVWPWV